MKTLLVYIVQRDAPLSVSEFVSLAESTDLSVSFIALMRIRQVHQRHYLGGGQIADLAELCQRLRVSQVILSNPLKSTYQRHIVTELNVSVIDLNELIMDIFANRAKSYEGKLQVELAQCRYLSARLKGGWTHLERQKGGIGLRGPGETQLETDRRLLQKRISHIEKRVDKVMQTRNQNRKKRQESHQPIIGIVGYTNAGKSCLFNQLTSADVYVQQQVFATLDPTVRRIKYPDLNHCCLIDTVGFMQSFPQELIHAFAATLKELEYCDFMIHLVDAADQQRQHKVDSVNKVLASLELSMPVVTVYNKKDLLSQEELSQLCSVGIVISSTSHDGIRPLLEFIHQKCGKSALF